MSEIVDFLLARIADDEEDARNSSNDDSPGTWRHYGESMCSTQRAIIELVKPDPSMPVDSGRFVSAGVLALLASTYAYHRDFNPEWIS